MRILLAIAVMWSLAASCHVVQAQIPGDLPQVAVPTPSVDTLWTRKIQDFNLAGFTACAMGGSPRVLLAVATIELSNEQKLIAFNVETGDTMLSLRSGHNGTIQHMSFARYANVFATAEKGIMKVWRWPELEVIKTITMIEGSRITNQSTALLTSDGTRIFDACNGVMYDVATGDTVWSWKRNLVFPLPKITPDDRYLMVYNCDEDGTCQSRASLLDATTGTELASFPGGSGRGVIAAMAISDDGRYVAVTRLPETPPGEDGSLVVYDREIKQVVMQKVLKLSEGGHEVIFTPNGTGILNGGGELSPVWSLEFMQPWNTEPTYRFAYTGFQFSSDWKYSYGNISGRISVSRFNLETVPVQEQESRSTNMLFPNPTDGTISIRVANATDGPVRFEISTITGSVSSQGFTSLAGGECRITPLPFLSVGSYVIRLTRGAQLLYSSSLIVK